MEINWEQLWIDAKKDSVLSKYRKDIGIERWNREAEEYSDRIKKNGYKYGQQIIGVIKEIIEPDFEVLDVGAGPGTIAIPLAKRVKKVTALDPSKGMIKLLEESAVEAEIENIETQNKTWQKVDDAEIGGKFDLVITSNVLWQFEDVGTQLMRIHDASRKYCCVVHHAGLINDELWSKMWSEIMNEEYNFDFDTGYIYIYNILYSKGIYANVEVIDSDHTFEKSVDDAVGFYEYHLDQYTEITPGVKEIIKDCIVEHAVNGIYRRESKMKSAVMWWKKMRKNTKKVLV